MGIKSAVPILLQVSRRFNYVYKVLKQGGSEVAPFPLYIYKPVFLT